MFKSFFGKIGFIIKTIPHKAVSFVKDTATVVTGVAYFMVWAPVACVLFYLNLFKGFGEICIGSIKGFFSKFKKPVVEAEPVVAEA